MSKRASGHQVHDALIREGSGAAAILARDLGQPDLFERVRSVASEEPAASFLHSALCAMSLPVRRPRDDTQPILRQDGQYTLAITPKPVLTDDKGTPRLQTLGVPYGSLPRLILIHIMTEAVRTRSRRIVLGDSFTDWMRRLGYRTMSYGPRGSATLVRQQLDRLLACEWMIRWDGESASGDREFGIKEIKLTTEYAGATRPGGGFSREILLTEAFFDHLRQHAVPLNEHAIRELRDSATALDLYTWLAYRLPRVSPRRPATLGWQQLARHFGNDGTNIRKFRQTVRDAWDRHVSAVYPEARADFETALVRLHVSPPPLQRRLTHPLALVPPLTDGSGTPGNCFLAALRARLGEVEAQAWLGGARMTQDESGWVLLLPTAFKADWVRGQHLVALEQAKVEAGLSSMPTIAVAPR